MNVQCSAAAFAVAVVLSFGPGVAAAEDPTIEAKAAFERGKTQYAAGRFEQALAEFITAYSLTSRPVLLYNLGLCAEQLGEQEQAKAYYRGYLEKLPEAADAAEVRARIAALGEPPGPEPSPVQVQAPLPEARPGDPQELPPEFLASEPAALRSTLVAPGLLIGLGGLVLASGVITAIAAQDRYDGFESSCAPNCSSSNVDSARAAAVAADVQLFVGGAAAVAGVTWLLVKRLRRTGPVEVAIGPTGLLVSGRWP